MTIRFRSPVQPAHFVRRGEAGFKFVGGRLAVGAEDAELVRTYALANPSLGIVEEPRRRPRKPAADAKERTTARGPRPAGGGALQRGNDGTEAGS